MKAFYTDFERMKSEKYDGMIITGAPVEQMEFEEVTYWSEIQEIFDWARTHVTSTLYICWAAQAGLYHHYGIPKYPLEKKCSASSNTVPCNRCTPSFEGLTMCSTFRTAGIRR